MTRLIVLTAPDLTLGYRLAGAATVAVGSPEETAEALRELVDEEGERGVIAVHEPYHARLDPQLRRRFDETTEPLVVALPAGKGADAGVERKKRLSRMLWQAVGYEITFDAEGGTTQ
jgi:vacuolar-type H+-ATPase subunit F/Vma7